MKKTSKIFVLLGFISSLYASSSFICNNDVIDNIYSSFEILSNKLKTTPIKMDNVKLEKISVNRTKKMVIKYVKITDKDIINKIKKDKLFKSIALSLQTQETCKKYKTNIGKCFLNSGNNIVIIYLDENNKEIGRILINKKTCGFK